MMLSSIARSTARAAFRAQTGSHSVRTLSVLATKDAVGLSSSVVRRVAASPAIVHHRFLSSDLSDILKREFDEEESQGNAVMPEDLAELKAQVDKEWNIVNSELDGSSATLKMFRRTGAAKIAITVHCQDTIAAESEEGEEYFNEDEEEPPVSVRFTVTVQRAGRTMVLTCLSEDAAATVERVAIVSGDADSTTKGIDESLYQGPEFTELAEDLQEAFTSFLQTDCGVDTDVASFIAMYADYQEQAEYTNFLKQAQTFL
eukprot:scaffold24884_cov54-Attheya_sp.AAC.8